MDYSKLQNGSDIRGVALEGIEGQHINLTEAACKDIGRGFALWLAKKSGKLVVGFDAVKSAVIHGNAHIVLLANDLSEKTIKLFTNLNYSNFCIFEYQYLFAMIIKGNFSL